MRQSIIRIIIFALLTVSINCLNSYDPFQKAIGQGIAYAIAIALGLAILYICVKLAQNGYWLFSWIIIALIAFIFIPNMIKFKIFNIAFICFVVSSGILGLIGEFNMSSPRYLLRILNIFLFLGLFLLIPWGVAYMIKYGTRPLEILTRPFTDNISSARIILWIIFKIFFIVGLSRLLDYWLDNNGVGIFMRVLIRTILIWGLALIPFPIVFAEIWGDLVTSVGLCTVIDGTLDLLMNKSSFSKIVMVAILSISLTFIALPGVYALYTDIWLSPCGAIIALIFTTLSTRVYFFEVKYGMWDPTKKLWMQ